MVYVYPPFQQGNNPDYPDTLIIVTDGRSNNEDDTWRQAILDRNDGIQIIAVGVGDNVRMRELKGMASFPLGSTVFTVEEFEDLGDIADNITDLVCDGKWSILSETIY